MRTRRYSRTCPSREALCGGVQRLRQTGRRWRLRLLVACCAFALLTACANQNLLPDQDRLTAETIQIAQAYAQTGDPDQARAQLEAVGIENPSQWLADLAESRVADGENTEETAALVRLALAMRIDSANIRKYAEAHDLLPLASSAVAAATGQETLPTPTAQPASATQPSTLSPASPAVETPAPGSTPAASAMVSALQSAAQPPEEPTAEVVRAPAGEAPPVVLPTNTPILQPVARVVKPTNVRGGPGTTYPIVSTLTLGSQVRIVGRNSASDWWQVASLSNDSGWSTGWLYAPLVEVEGNVALVTVAEDIPEPPPTATVLPTVQTTVGPEEPSPVAEASAVAEATPLAPEAPSPAGPDFRVVEKRLWSVYENGGTLFGDSVSCGEKRQLVVVVLDAQGNRINGVAVQAEYGAREIFVTGSQGKGDGAVEFVLGGGQDVKVIRDNDGRAVTSEKATGLSTVPSAIPFAYLMAGQYCTDEESCRKFVEAPGCWGHYSWTVTFQRNG